MKSKRLQIAEYRNQISFPPFALCATPNRKGFIFIYAYLLIVLFMVYELALLTYFAQNINAFERFSNNTIAYQLAEAGLDSAMAQLKRNEIVFDANGNYTETRNFILGNYNVTVSNQQEDSDGDGASDGPLAPNTFRITTLASAPAVSNPARPIQQSTNVVAFVRKEEAPLFEYAVFGRDRMVMKGDDSYIDSYDSRNGSYYDQIPSSNADIRTNGIASNRINIQDTIVYGNAVVGPGADPDRVISPSENIRGTKTASNSPLIYEPLSTNIPSEGALECDHNRDCVLTPGVHHFDSINARNDSFLSAAAGPVKIYVDGNVHLSNDSVRTAGEIPGNLQLYVGGNVFIQNNVSFYGTIYAPNGVVGVKDTDIYGAVVARQFGFSDISPNDFRNNPENAIEMAFAGDNRFHYDEALKEIGGGQGAKMKLVSWRTVPIESNSADSSS